MAVVASFHLTRYPVRRALAAMARRRPPNMAKVPGLRFVRPLGTGRGEAMGLGADLRRWALFATWDDDEALDRFLDRSPVARRWAQHGIETWSVRLAPLRHHGTWRGHDPLEGTVHEDQPSGPVAVLTRATIPIRHWRSFYRALPPVERSLAQEPGVLAALGVGELPVGRLATFSLWRSGNDVDAFAYRGSPHHAVVRQARAEGWFAEELFARFRPYGSTGTWDGKDPLGGKGS